MKDFLKNVRKLRNHGGAVDEFKERNGNLRKALATRAEGGVQDGGEVPLRERLPHGDVFLSVIESFQ